MRKNQIRKRIAVICILLFLMQCLTGCEPRKGSANDPSLQKVLDAGQLVLGLDENYPPMGFRDKNGEIVGFDIDLAREVCNRLGVELVTKPIIWDKKEKELNAGNIDCIWNGMSVSPSRKESMNLTDAYVRNELIFVVPKDSELRTLEDLHGKRIGLQSGSSAEEVLDASELYANITEVKMDDNVELLERMENGALDAVFLDSVFGYYYIGEYDKDYFVLSTVLETEDLAIGFRKDDQTLKNKVWEILKEMKKDGTLAKISTDWFGADVTTVK